MAPSSLAQLAGSINRNANNPGVTAAVVHAADGDHIVLTATKTGAANAFSVTGTGDVAALSYDPTTGTGGLTAVTHAQDAKLSIDGFDVTSASNAVQGAIQGVTINLTAVSGTTPDTLTVAADNGAIQKAVQTLVDNYNKLVGTTKTLTSYDSGSGKAGALLGDSTMLGVTSRLSRSLGTQFGTSGDAVRSLADIGIKFEVDGSLSLDSDKLSAALAGSPEQVRSHFRQHDGHWPVADADARRVSPDRRHPRWPHRQPEPEQQVARRPAKPARRAHGRADARCTRRSSPSSISS